MIIGATVEVGVYICACACVVKLFLLISTPDFKSNVGKDGGTS